MILTTEETTASTPADVPMMERAICITLYLGVLGNSRKVPISQVEVDADKALIRANKTLLDCSEYKAIQSADGRFRDYLYSRCLPSNFQPGTYLLPLKLVNEVENRLRAYDLERGLLVDAFCAAYPARVREVETRLRGVFNAKDYPPVGLVRRRFRMEWNYVSFGTPGKLEEVSAELFRESREKLARQVEEAGEAVKAVLRTQMAELTNHMVERLSGTGANGRAKTFRNTLLDNMADFLDVFQVRNIADDTALAALVTQARQVLNGTSPDMLREDDATRQYVRERFETIKTTLTALVCEKPGRKISFED